MRRVISFENKEFLLRNYIGKAVSLYFIKKDEKGA
jgi:hypothetical protein